MKYLECNDYTAFSVNWHKAITHILKSVSTRLLVIIK